MSRSPESVSSSNLAPSKFFAVALRGKGGDLFKFSVDREVTDDPRASLSQVTFTKTSNLNRWSIVGQRPGAVAF